MRQSKSVVKKLGAYTLAAGAAAVMAQATPSQATMQVYDNPGGASDGGDGWYDVTNDWNQDHLTFKMDGTVVTNSGNIPGLQVLGQDDDSFTFSERDFYWWGTEEKDAMCLNVGANVGYVAGYGDVWNVGRPGGGYEVGPTLADGRVWSDRAVTETGGLGGWNFYFAGEWPFGGNGYVGLYADDVDGRHYGWAHISWNSWNNQRLLEFGFSDVAGMPVYVGGGEVGGPPPAPGDFDGDGDIDSDDIGLLCANLTGAGNPAGDPIYDLDGDGDADQDDMDMLIHDLVEITGGDGTGTEYGDFDLDGDIDTTDLTILATNYGVGTTWLEGNANCDLVIDTTDLTIMATNFGFLASGAVPEPVTLSLLALGAPGLLAMRRRRS